MAQQQQQHLQLHHVKGFNAGLQSGAVQAHPAEPGCFFYAAANGVVCVYDGDPTRKVQLRGHDGPVSAFALSPDGALLATAQRGFNCDVVLWELAGGGAGGGTNGNGNATGRGRARQRSRFQEHDVAVAALAFSCDGRLLATAGCEDERRLFVLDSSTGAIVAAARLPGERERVAAMAWSPAPAGAATPFGSSSGGSGSGSGRLAPPPVPPAHEFATAQGAQVLFWSVEPFKGLVSCERATMGSVRRAITSLAYSPDGAWLFAGTEAGDVVTLNARRRAAQLVHPIAGGGVGSLTVLPPLLAGGAPAAAATRLLVGAGDGGLCLFDAPGGGGGGGGGAPGGLVHSAPVAALPGAVGAVSLAAPHARDYFTFIVSTRVGGIYTVHLPAALLQQHNASARHASATLLARIPPSVWGFAQQGPLTGAAFQRGIVGGSSGGGVLVASSSADGTVCVWGAEDFGLRLRAAEPRGCAALCVDFAGESGAAGGGGGGAAVVSGWSDGSVRCHGVQGGGGDGAAAGAARQLWSIPGAHAASAGVGARAVRSSTRGHYVATGGACGALRLWDSASRELVSHLKHHTAAVTSLAVADDDARIAASGEDRCWTLWDAPQERLLAAYPSPLGAVRCVALGPDRVTAAAVGIDRAVTLWDLRAPAAARGSGGGSGGGPAAVIAGAHAAEATAVAWHPGGGGTLLATGGADAAVRLWDARRAGGGSSAGGGSGGGSSGRAAAGSGGGGGPLVAERADAHMGAVAAVAFSPDGRRLVSAGADGCLCTWQL